MKKLLKTIFTLILCLPMLFFSSCGKSKSLVALDYYFNKSAKYGVLGQSEAKSLDLEILTAEKPNLEYLNSYTYINLSSYTAKMYHFYIESISFKVYTRAVSKNDFNIYITINNAIEESNVGVRITDDEKEKITFSNMPSIQPKEDGSSDEIKIPVNRVIYDATSVVNILFDAKSQSQDFIEENKDFKWMIYDLKIYGESRAYNIPETPIEKD